jgi:Zn-dependent M16 (insulinase) family peptidase
LIQTWVLNSHPIQVSIVAQGNQSHVASLVLFLTNAYLLYSTSCLSIGLQGVKDSDVKTVQDTIKNVLQDAMKEGFDPKRIEAAIHQMELGQKHVSKKDITYTCIFILL